MTRAESIRAVADEPIQARSFRLDRGETEACVLPPRGAGWVVHDGMRAREGSPRDVDTEGAVPDHLLDLLRRDRTTQVV